MSYFGVFGTQKTSIFGRSQLSCQMRLLRQQDDPSGITCEEPEMIQTQTLTWPHATRHTPHATGSHGVAGIHSSRQAPLATIPPQPGRSWAWPSTPNRSIPFPLPLGIDLPRWGDLPSMTNLTHQPATSLRHLQTCAPSPYDLASPKHSRARLPTPRRVPNPSHDHPSP